MIILLPQSSFVLRICFPTSPIALLGTLYLFMNFPSRSAQNRTENGNPEAQVSPWPHILISITLPLKTVRSICCSLIISWAYLDQSQTVELSGHFSILNWLCSHLSPFPVLSLIILFWKGPCWRRKDTEHSIWTLSSLLTW